MPIILAWVNNVYRTCLKPSNAPSRSKITLSSLEVNVIGSKRRNIISVGRKALERKRNQLSIGPTCRTRIPTEINETIPYRAGLARVFNANLE
jgi:hypothetical protein